MTYESRKNHLYGGTIYRGYNKALDPSPYIGEKDYTEEWYQMLENNTIETSKVIFDPEQYAFALTGWTTYLSPGIVDWTQYTDTYYLWNGTKWVFDNTKNLTSTYNSFYQTQSYTLTPIPEPSICMLIGIGVIGMGCTKRLKTRSIA